MQYLFLDIWLTRDLIQCLCPLQASNSPISVSRKIKFSQDFYLTSQINIILYWLLTMELSTLIDLEVVIMLLQQVVEKKKNKSMMLNKRSSFVGTSHLNWMRKEYFIPGITCSYIWVPKKPLVTDPCIKQKLWWRKLFFLCVCNITVLLY